jgi:hypothetical protein
MLGCARHRRSCTIGSRGSRTVSSRPSARSRPPLARAACFAAEQAGLKALGLGLHDGGMFDTMAPKFTGSAIAPTWPFLFAFDL